MSFTLRAASCAVLVSSCAFGQGLAYSVAGAPGDASFGTATTIADLDGDLRRDLIVSAPDTGAVRLLSGASGALLLAIDGPVGFGTSVAATGDLDGDGLSDVAVGNPEGAGTVTVFSSADGQQLAAYVGGVTGGEFGASLAGVGDVDGDGLPDLAIGAPGWAGDAGAVFIVGGLGGPALLVAHGATPGARYGASLSVDDIATDDEPGLVIGMVADDEPGLVIGMVADDEPGLVIGMVADDEPGLVIGMVADDEPGLVIGLAADDEPGLVIGSGAEAGGFTSVVTHAGDVDGDGRGDLLVSAPDLGRVSMHSSVDGAMLYDVVGGDPVSSFGAATAILSDVDGDGVHDFAVGDPDGLGASGRTGRVTIHSGVDGALLHAFEGAEDGARFGASLAALDAPDHADVIVGAPGAIGGRGVLTAIALDGDWSSLGGQVGDPLLVADGTLTPGETIVFGVDQAPAGASAALVLGGALTVDPLSGELTPTSDLVVPGLVTGVDGRLQIVFALPSDVASGTALYAQVLVEGADGSTLRTNPLSGVVGG